MAAVPWKVVVCHVLLAMSRWSGISAETVETCNGVPLVVECPINEVIVTHWALFGRMEQGRCIPENDFIGCQNDVLYLADRSCSGHIKCVMVTDSTNRDLEAANTQCKTFLKMYLVMEYTCIKVTVNEMARCSNGPFTVTGNEGILSSHVTEGTGCGSPRSPWMIAAMPGQTIQLNIIDFGSEQNSSLNELYGYIQDGDLKIPIKGGTQRERPLHTSTSNQVWLEFIPGGSMRQHGFLVQFQKTGCPDLTPPTHAWYKRDGHQAVIGCEWSQKTWHLSCDGHSWTGVVGNCSAPANDVTGPEESDKEPGQPSALWLVCVVSMAVVLIVVACVICIVCIKKNRIKQDVQKSMTLQRLPGQGHYDLDPSIEMASMLYLPYKSCEQEQGAMSVPQRPTSYLVPQDQVVNELSPIHIWERPLPDLPDKPLASGTVCSKRGRTPGDGDEAVSSSNPQESGTPQSYQGDMSTINPQQLHNDNPTLVV